MKINEFKRRVSFTLLAVIFRGSLDWFYVFYQPFLEIKWKFQYNPRSAFEFFLAYFLLLVVTWAMPCRMDKPSKFILFLFYFITYIPCSSYISFSNQYSFVPFLNLTFFFIVTPALLYRFFNKDISIPKLNSPPYYNTLIILCITTFFFVIQLTVFGFSLDIPSLTDVYDVRDAYKESSGRFDGYATSWTANVLAVFLFVYGLTKKNWLFVGLAIFLDIYIFTFTGFKAVILSLGFVLLILIGYKFFKTNLNFYLISIFSFINSLILLLIREPYDIAFTVGVLISRRMFMVPSQLYFMYTEFATSNPIDLFAQYLPFSWFISSNYSVGIPYVIGYQYFQIPELSANANIFADFSVNLGNHLGVPVLVLVMFLLLKFVDGIAQNKETILSFALFTMPTIAMTNSALLSSLMTHGFLIAIFVLYLSNNTRSEKGNHKES